MAPKAMAPTAKDLQACLEAARSVVLVAHSAAGLCAASRCCRAAERLLRSCEATARMASTLLAGEKDKTRAAARAAAGSPEAPPGAAGGTAAAAAAVPGAAQASSSRRRARRSRKKASNANMDTSDDLSSAPLVGGASPPARDEPAAPAPAAAGRQLKKQISRERSPRRDSPSTSPPHGAEGRVSGVHPVGSRLKLQNLVSRPELCGNLVQVLSYDSATGRYGVKVDSTGENIRVRADSLAS